MAIGTAVKRGASILILNEHGQQIGQLPASGPNDAVAGYTSSSVSVRQGGMINTFELRPGGALQHINGTPVETPRASPVSPTPQQSPRLTRAPRTTSAEPLATPSAGVVRTLFVVLVGIAAFAWVNLSDKTTSKQRDVQRRRPADIRGMVRTAEAPGAESTPPIFFHVTGIRSGDYLNVRDGPGSSYKVLAKLSSTDGAIIPSHKEQMNGGTVWWLVTKGDLTGWVNRQYLAPDSR